MISVLSVCLFFRKEFSPILVSQFRGQIYRTLTTFTTFVLGYLMLKKMVDTSASFIRECGLFDDKTHWNNEV